MSDHRPSSASRAVFLSYASQDAEAAKRICEALRAAGVEVWFDQSELVGGDAWDRKIRRQIKECALFVPIISTNTQARAEGYFRREWKHAVERTHDMADDVPFIFPIVLDDVTDASARVPDKFREVQWTRLRLDETPTELAVRVARLLSGEPAPVTPRTAAATRARLRPKSAFEKWWWLLFPIFGMTMSLILVLKPHRSPEDVAKLPGEAQTIAAVVAKTSVAPPPTEAQKLVAQARKIYDDGDELNRDNLFLAEEMVQRALALDPTEPTAWELGAWLSYMMVWHLIDESPARRETLLRQANRALALAPEAVTSQLVYANAQLAGRFMVRDAGQSHLEETEQGLRRLAEREPQNWKIPRALGTVYRLMNRTDDAISTLERALELSGDHPMAVADLVNVYIRRQRLPEAEALLARALPHQRSGRLLTFDVVVKCRWRGDTAGALKTIETWPAWLLQEDRGLALAWQAAYWGHQPEAALRVVQQFPRDEVRDLNFSGPRAVLSARAHEMAGNTAAAQVDWHTVVQRSDQSLAGNPQDVLALLWKAWALARLGDQSGAQAVATLLRQHMRSVASGFFNVNTAAPLWATVGWTDLALADLRALLEKPVDGYSLTRAYLELEPAFDPIRLDPRFQALLGQAPAPVAESSKIQTPNSRPETPDPGPSRPPLADAKSVAVLAFANLSDDKGNEYFSDGISEELLNVLAKVPGLKVTARTSAFYFKGKEVPIPEIAQKLGVAYVVEGSVRKAGDKVRITAQLIKAADGFHVWSDTFTRDLKDIFAVQDEIAGLIAQQLQLKLAASDQVKREVNPEAHQRVLEGWHYLGLRTSTGFDRAEQAFRAALQLDPQFAVAHAGLANVSALRGRYRLLSGIGRSNEFTAQTLAEGQLALQLDPTLAEAHAAMGSALTDNRQFDEAEAEFQKAFASNPSYGVAYHWYCHVVAARGRLDLALQQTDRSVAFDPYAFIAHFIHVAYGTDARRFAASLAEADQAATLRTDVFLPLEAERIRCLVGLGRKDEALAVARRALRNPDLLATGWWCAGDALYALRQCGAEAEAVAAGDELLKTVPRENYIRGYVLCALGRYAEGIPALDSAPAILQGRMSWIPMFDPVRDTPAFRQLLERLNCVQEDKVARETLARLLKEQEAKK